jgi:multidrug resistance efflux pump
MSEDTPKKSLTVFKSDRHEDIAAIILAAIVVIATLIYMSLLVPSVTVTADSDGKILSVNVREGVQVKKGDTLYTLNVVEKKWKGDKVEETVKEKIIKAKTNGKVLKVFALADSPAKKGKTPVLELEHEKGTLP